jgi:predicted transposase YbfD/YdcC
METLDFGHGRIETRRCSITTDLGLMEHAQNWTSLNTLIRVDSERCIKSTGEVQTSTRFYISSLKAEANTFMRAIRHHWSIENGLHWALDVSFHEDDQRKRAGNAVQNYSIIARMALTALKQEQSIKLGIKSKRLNAG